jgi:hypothetical protein
LRHFGRCLDSPAKCGCISNHWFLSRPLSPGGKAVKSRPAFAFRNPSCALAISSIAVVVLSTIKTFMKASFPLGDTSVRGGDRMLLSRWTRIPLHCGQQVHCACLLIPYNFASNPAAQCFEGRLARLMTTAINSAGSTGLATCI